MRLKDWRTPYRTGRSSIGLSAAMIATLFVLLALSPSPSFALTAEETGEFFGSETGDAYTSIFLNQIFGPLFPAVDGTTTETVFSSLIGDLNLFFVTLGGALFFWNGVVGVLQSGQDGKFLGNRWSSLWAPFRVVFAIGLMIPMPNLGGYNVGEAGIGYAVKGSTKIASYFWTSAAKFVVNSTVAITSSPPRLDPKVISVAYQNAACQAIVNYQYQVVNGNNSVRVVEIPLDDTVLDGDAHEVNTRLNYTTAILDANGTHQFKGICGQYITPALPLFLQHLEDGDSVIATMPANAKNAIIVKYIAAYQTAMQTLMNGTGSIKGMHAIASENLPSVISDKVSLPEITDDILALYNVINAKLAEDIRDIKDAAVGVDRKGQAARDALLARIEGTCTEDKGSDSSGVCYGEGWIGAGSWYMTMAHLSNELQSLSSGEIEIDPGTYIEGSQGDSGARDLYVANGGTRPWKTYIGFSDTGATDAGFSPSEEATYWFARYQEIYDNSTAGLAALGFPMSNELLHSLNVNTSATGLLANAEGYTRARDKAFNALMDLTSPSRFGQDDPMIGLVKVGNALTYVMGALIMLGVVGGFATGGATGSIFGPMIQVLALCVATLTVILPLMPFIFWILAVTGYFLLVIEAVIAVNLWALAHMRMDGDGISGEAGRNGWIMILALTMTPPLMVFGFLVGMQIFRASSDMIDIGLHQAASGIFSGNPFMDLIAIVGFAVLICIIYVILLERSFSLVSEFPGRVLRWMGASAQLTNGEEGKARAAAGGALAGIYKMSGSASGAAMRGASNAGVGSMGGGKNQDGTNRGGYLYRKWGLSKNAADSGGEKKDEKKPPENNTGDEGNSSG